MTTVLNRRNTAESVSKSVKYTPCKVEVQTDEEELEEVNTPRSRNTTPLRHLQSVSSNPSAAQSLTASPWQNLDDGRSTPTAAGGYTANGPPRGLPGSLTTFHGTSSSDRASLIGECLSRTPNLSISSPLYPVHTNVEPRARSTSKQSLFELVTHRLDRVKTRKSRAFSKEEVAYVNKGHVSDAMTPKEIRKQRRKDIEHKFGKKSRVAQADAFETLTASSDKEGCRWTFVFDPSGRLAYWWSFVVSIAFLYNFWVIIYRFAFEEINEHNIAVWFSLDYLADLLYILDVGFHFRTGFLEDGVLQTDSVKLRLHYMNSTMFYIDCLCLLPLDFLYLSIGFKSMLRCFRLVKIYRFWAFLDRTERHTNYPNVVRTITLLHYLFAVYHWNACFMHLVTKNLSNENWNNPPDTADVLTKYLHALYWSVLTLTTIGDLPRPTSKGEHIFVIVEFVFGLLLFASILGHVANIVTSISFARKDFQAKLDSVKTYMILRRVPLRLQDRVIRWFDYLWLSKKSSDEEKTLNLLPDKLKAEIALHVHLDTLKRVEIFQNTEAGFLCELVLKLRPVLFSPGDYICRKGEVGKEMYIVARGRLQVVADNGKTVLATLRPGSYFGEISILNMGNAGNRRTASVRSVGYSDLFCLKKQDLWEVLKDYPTARVRLEAIAVKRLEKYKKAPLEQGKEDLAKVALPRSKSTPGLVESRGKVPLEQMIVHHFLSETSKDLTPPPSLCSGISGRGDGAGSERQFSFHSGSGELAAGAATGQTEQSEITHSMTVSSITSYVTDSSGKKSPHGAAGGHASPAHHRPRESPPLLTDTDSYLPVCTNPFTALHGFHTTTATPSTLAMATALLPRTAHTTTVSPFPTTATAFQEYFSPFPPEGLAGRIQGSPLSTSQTLPPIQRVTTASGVTMSASVSSIPVDPNTAVLLAEITRLRDRLQTLESENSSMSKKLNQQKWEVEHRLAEIEMHICGSDNGSILDDDNVLGNKESVI